MQTTTILSEAPRRADGSLDMDAWRAARRAVLAENAGETRRWKAVRWNEAAQKYDYILAESPEGQEVLDNFGATEH